MHFCEEETAGERPGEGVGAAGVRSPGRRGCAGPWKACLRRRVTVTFNGQGNGHLLITIPTRNATVCSRRVPERHSEAGFQSGCYSLPVRPGQELDGSVAPFPRLKGADKTSTDLRASRQLKKLKRVKFYLHQRLEKRVFSRSLTQFSGEQCLDGGRQGTRS